MAVSIGKYMEVELIEEKPKTQVLRVKSKSDGSQLGIIKWFGPWRQYCFFVTDTIVLSAGCCKDIVSFLEKFNYLHKGK